MELSSVAEGELVRIGTPELEKMVKGNPEEPKRWLALEETKRQSISN